MTDDPNPMQSQHPQGRGTTNENISDYAEVGKTLIQGIAPAEKGWILGFICVVAIIVLSDMWVNIQTIKANTQTSVRVQEYFEMVEENRSSQGDQMAQVFSDQVRRSQEVIRDLAQAVSRDSERSGLAAVSAIENRSEFLKDGGSIPEPVGGLD